MVGCYKSYALTDLVCPPPSTQVETLTCESRQSNPAPQLRWYLGDRELQGEQSDAAEAGDERRWRSTNALRHKFAKDDFGKSLACKVEHPAYSTGVRMATVLLDVLCECYTVHLAKICLVIQCPFCELKNLRPRNFQSAYDLVGVFPSPLNSTSYSVSTFVAM